MMRTSLLAYLLGTAFLLPACGFHPMYGAAAIDARPQMQNALNSIEIGLIPDHSGLMLRNFLIDRFYKNGHPQNPVYSLSFAPIKESREDLDITVDEETTRSQLRQSTAFTLTRLDTGEAVLTRSIYSIASYNVLESQFTTRVTAENARQNGINDLARQTEQAIVLYLGNPEPSLAFTSPPTAKQAEEERLKAERIKQTEELRK